MSFMDEIGKMAGGALGGASPEAAASAASEHVESMDPSQLGDHLTQSLGSMDQSSLAGLGQQLLSSFTNHPGYDGDANTATQDAGVSQAAVAAGDPGAVGTLINMAKNNPAVLQQAASMFLGKNPSAIGSLAPGLLQGIMGRLGGR
ncbi:MAG: hypothetical protein NVS2B8_19330 [Vulcanimicrobiaceae bacterium]